MVLPFKWNGKNLFGKTFAKYHSFLEFYKTLLQLANIRRRLNLR